MRGSTDSLGATSRGVTWFPEHVLAGSAHVSLSCAAKLLDRAGTADTAPLLGAAVLDGMVSGEHLDALTRALRSAQPELRDELHARADALVDVAGVSSPDEFARRLRLEARRLEADDGMTRCDHQCRDTRLRRWTDRKPACGAVRPPRPADRRPALSSTQRRTIPSIRRGRARHLPLRPIEQHEHLRALAIVALVEGKGSGFGRPEAIVVLDTPDLDPVTGGPIID